MILTNKDLCQCTKCAWVGKHEDKDSILLGGWNHQVCPNCLNPEFILVPIKK